MIYGFGTREYLATGYKAEVTTGYSWGEFNDALYLGASYETGGFPQTGYIMGGFTLKGKLHRPRKRHVAAQRRRCRLRWFSNLSCSSAAASASSSPSTTRRAGTATAATRASAFTRTDGLQALKEYIIGTNRMISTPRRWYSPLPAAGIPHRRLFADFRADRLFAQYLQKRLLHLRSTVAAAKRTAGVQHDPDPAGRGLRQTRTGRERIFPPFEPDTHGAVPLPTDAARDRRIQIGIAQKAEDSVESAFVNFFYLLMVFPLSLYLRARISTTPLRPFSP